MKVLVFFGPGAQVQISRNKKRRAKARLFAGEKERFAASGQLKPSIHTSHAKPRSCSLGFCQFCALPLSSTGSGRARIPRASGAQLQISRNKKRRAKARLFVPEKERFELSRRLPDLHPQQGRLFSLLSTSPYHSNNTAECVIAKLKYKKTERQRFELWVLSHHQFSRLAP